MARRYLTNLLLSALCLWPVLLAAQSQLEECAAQFIDSNVANAPTIGNSAPDEPFLSNVQQCYRDDGVSFYALEYWPEEFAPRWTAYKLSPENYGENGCKTYTRDKADCYFSADTWPDFLSCTKSHDPFHHDERLTGQILNDGDFGLTGHDNGHIAPRAAFSWDVCGTYQTFTMANMSPQRAYLNQQIWANLEAQVLTWAVDEGPLYVVSGTTFRSFPSSQFAVYEQDHVLDPDQIYPRNSRMLGIVKQNQENFEATSSGDLLHPLRKADPDRVKPIVQNMLMPTGYFKVIYRPAMDGEPAHAIGFLLPHTFVNLNLLADSYDNMSHKEAFWAFAARIDLIERTSGMRFPGIPDDMKQTWRSQWFWDRRGAHAIRADSCGAGMPQGVLENSTKQERVAACTDQLD